MKKKLYAIYALAGAMAVSPIFTSCVEDSESQSVTELRGAKAEQLKAAAELAKAQEQAELTLANAEAALMAAQAAYQNALAEASKADAAYQEELLKQAQEKFALEIAALQAKTERDLAMYQQELNYYKTQLEDAEYTRFNTLYARYQNELSSLMSLQQDLVSKKNGLARLENNVISTEAYNQNTIKSNERAIAAYEAQIALLQDSAYASMNQSEAFAKYTVAQKEADLAITTFNASEAPKKLLAASNLVREKREACDKIINDFGLFYNNVLGVILDSPRYINLIRQDVTDAYYNTIINYTWNIEEDWQYFFFDFYIDESEKLNEIRNYANWVEHRANELGKADDKSDANTAYGRLAKANEDLAAAQKALDEANKLPETTDQEKLDKEAAIAAAEQLIADAEMEVANKKDDFREYENEYNNAVKEQAEFEEKLAAFDVEAANKLAEEFKAAIEALEAEWEAYYEAAEAAVEKSTIANILENIYWNETFDVEEEINNLNQWIMDCKSAIEEAKVNDAEQTLANAKEEIANLEEQIAIQEKIVADAKAALNAYLAEPAE